MATQSKSPISFGGVPGALEAIVPVPPAVRKSIQVVARGKSRDLKDLTVLTAPVNAGATLVRVLAAPTTPPGSYQGRVVSEAGEFECTIEVAPQPQVSVQPPTLEFHCPAGGTASANIVVLNTGNTAVSFRKTYAFGLLEEGAVFAGIRRGLAMRERAAGESRVEAAGDAIAEGYGGLAKLQLKGAADVPPGASAQLTADLRLDERAKGSRRYRGTWVFDGGKLSVFVDTGGAAPDGEEAE
jgi:hypothetical protein